ncbi:hypothetical protein [Halalkalibacter flavus]|uniref:Ger(x)C family spore germination protein n=1 Tax=Halalkalibacter flavus TaxID=3090668 RepID=UPI002FC9BBB8
MKKAALLMMAILLLFGCADPNLEHPVIEDLGMVMMDVSTLTEKTLTSAQLRVVLFSEEFARKRGVMKELENLYRDPQVGSNVFVAVVKGTVEDILTATYKDKPEINNYINELLTVEVLLITMERGICLYEITGRK